MGRTWISLEDVKASLNFKELKNKLMEERDDINVGDDNRLVMHEKRVGKSGDRGESKSKLKRIEVML